MTELNILALSGSLRADSHNTALLHAARALDPGGVAIDIDRDLGRLPLYNQDLDTGTPPAPVTTLRARIAGADALLIATPEHNASVPVFHCDTRFTHDRRLTDPHTTDLLHELLDALAGKARPRAGHPYTAPRSLQREGRR
ncbi:NADPH-dependent FMN reductase [Nonomuraea sp. B10E15]|uniref:NADPH-dependent FMN reductase n=1 Tax=Nonomuraea sp. B10E15 TaxID=3153560 RepID=UPI00325DD134